MLGHAWADPEVEREHEARGSEAVVTVREFRTCKRCGDRDVLGEVTEVKPADEVPADGSEAAVKGIGDDSPASTDDGADATSGEIDDDAEIIDDGGADGASGRVDDTGHAHERPEAEEQAEGDGRPADEDDGVILDADEEVDRDSAEWPDPGLPDDEDVEYEPRPWPNAEPPDPEPQGPREPDTFETVEPTGDRPEGGGEPVDPAEFLSEAASEQDRDPDDGDAGEELPLEDVEVFCPNCEFVDERPTPSLRGGDSCPACRTSYLEEREDQA